MVVRKVQSLNFHLCNCLQSYTNTCLIAIILLLLLIIKRHNFSAYKYAVFGSGLSLLVLYLSFFYINITQFVEISIYLLLKFWYTGPKLLTVLLLIYWLPIYIFNWLIAAKLQ